MICSEVSGACDGCRPENHKEAKRKREEIKWEPGSAQKAKKSRSERAGSREHKHKHKEKCAPNPCLLCITILHACLPCIYKPSFLHAGLASRALS